MHTYLLTLKQLLQSMKVPMSDLKFTLFTDNQPARKMAQNPITTQRSKHIDIRFHFIREHVEARAFRLEYCPTKDMLADVLTKNLTAIKFKDFRDQLLGHVPVQWSSS